MFRDGFWVTFDDSPRHTAALRCNHSGIKRLFGERKRGLCKASKRRARNLGKRVDPQKEADFNPHQQEITEELDYQPSQFVRRHYVRFVYADPKKQMAPKMPPLPPRVIPQAGVGVGMLVNLLVSKYTECRYRQSVFYPASETMPKDLPTRNHEDPKFYSSQNGR